MDEMRNDIAVIGMSGAFPGAENLDEYWNNLLSGKCSITDVCESDLVSSGISKEVYEKQNYVLKTSSLSNISHFDASFFGYTPAEARLIDPQHRLFLQHSWKALESAGFIPDEIGDSVGVYAGCSMNRYLLNNIDINTQSFDINDFQKMLASEKDYLTTRVSHKLNLRGPSINVQTACSTSLVAIQLAVLSLQTYQCDVALSGGVTVNVPHKVGYLHSEGMIFSPEGYCKPFSSQSDGTVFGEGVGVVVLKRLADAIEDNDNILAVVKGAATNNDGRNKVGFTAPSVEGQSEVISLAQELADVEPHQIQFIETHGTATALGDPIELAGLNDAFEEFDESNAPCALGTLKANIGHLDAAAGVASFIKSILVVKNKKIPPNLSFNNEYPFINQDGSPFYFNKEKVNLSHLNEIHAGVSSFGVGGTNAHIVLSSPPEPNYEVEQNVKDNSLLLFSAQAEDSVQALQKSFTKFLTKEPNKALDSTYALLNTRKKFSQRTYTQILNHDNSQLEFKESELCFTAKLNPTITFMFPGQGSQYQGMSKALYNQYEIYRHYFDECITQLIVITGQNYHDVIMDVQGDLQNITHTQNAQISLFVVEYCLAKTFITLNVKPKTMIGHSIGEYTAACLAGVFSLEDALWLVSERGRLMAQSAKGGMVSVLDSMVYLEELLFGSLCISIENSPENTVVSGSESDIEKLIVILLSKNIHHRKLLNQHAFHSAFMDSVLGEFSQVVEKIQLNPPSIDIIPSTPGYSCSDLNTSEYWVQHLRKEVCFHDVVKQSIQDSDIMLEVGPGAALCSFVQSSMSNENTLAISSMANAKYADKEQSIFLNSLGQLWCMGIEVEFKKIGIGTEGKAFGLPTYEFSKQEYWLERKIAKIGEAQIDESETSIVPHQKSETILDVESSLLEIWKQVLGITDLKVDDNYFEIGGDSLLSVDLFSKIKVKYKITLPISTLFTHPTISLLTKKLSDELKVQNKTEDTLTCNNRDEPWDTSVVMHPGPAANEKTLFIVGGVGGNVNNLYDLAKSLGKEYQVVGLQTRGILEHNYHDTVEKMAKDHIQYIKKHQPKGPYLLAGYSYGAYTAFEIAKQFEEQGEKIDFLGLLDVYAPGLSSNAPGLPTISSRAKKLKTKLKWHIEHGLIDIIKVMKLKLELRFYPPVVDSLSTEHKRYEKFFYYWNKVSEIYKGGVINSNISLFKSPSLNYKEVLWDELDETRGWSTMSKCGVKSHDLIYGHLEMMQGSNAKNLAEEILNNINQNPESGNQ
ncbi:acyltransferase domain-containing protein [Pseudoalteromonas sp. C2R02]|uniref:type I polyketide synthase n=1 Tax=Pseudoalteromonas sp. C2R02 TaxID=2841565 RepID=UPI001C094CDB|nr:type I polyketide synthase [Pseudoalteromonas sp. C2R02]MBU2969549.1 acyltransferase domain-containing protein [Pseudoalteromonas sp. C2R02]